MKKGDVARQSIINGIVNMFNEQGCYVGIQDKKIYVTAQDGPGGEQIQFAISLTMPKNPITANSNNDLKSEKSNPNDWTESRATELSPEDKASIDRLKEMLGI